MNKIADLLILEKLNYKTDIRAIVHSNGDIGLDYWDNDKCDWTELYSLTYPEIDSYISEACISFEDSLTPEEWVKYDGMTREDKLAWQLSRIPAARDGNRTNGIE